METKTKYVKEKHVEQYIEDMKHFGWELLATSKRGNKVAVNLKRSKDLHNYSLVRKFEKQYRKIKSFPLSAIVLGLLGTLFFIPVIFLEKYDWYLFSAVISLVLAFLGLFILITGIVLLIFSPQMVRDIFVEADVLTGNKKITPLENNLLAPNEKSFMIKKEIYK